MMDDLDRDKFYSTTSDEDEGLEYELEPPDAEVLAAEERRAQEAIDATRVAIDIDEIYREVDRDRGGEILEGWTRDFRFRFQIKHLLIATAVLAIVLTLAHHRLLWTALALLVMAAVAVLYLYLQWQEKKYQDEVERRRHEMYARRRAQFGQQRSAAGAAAAGELAPPSPNEIDRAWQQAQTAERFRFQFSLLELMSAMFVAALILGMVRVLGGPANTATLLGLVALLGLVIHAVGVRPPYLVVLGWWLILVMYVLLSIVAVAWQGFA